MKKGGYVRSKFLPLHFLHGAAKARLVPFSSSRLAPKAWVDQGSSRHVHCRAWCRNLWLNTEWPGVSSQHDSRQTGLLAGLFPSGATLSWCVYTAFNFTATSVAVLGCLLCTALCLQACSAALKPLFQLGPIIILIIKVIIPKHWCKASSEDSSCTFFYHCRDVWVLR